MFLKSRQTSLIPLPVYFCPSYRNCLLLTVEILACICELSQILYFINFEI
jgi:hypothetical protein